MTKLKQRSLTWCIEEQSTNTDINTTWIKKSNIYQLSRTQTAPEPLIQLPLCLHLLHDSSGSGSTVTVTPHCSLRHVDNPAKGHVGPACSSHTENTSALNLFHIPGALRRPQCERCTLKPQSLWSYKSQTSLWLLLPW